jgi:GTPase SAR1 family protein
MPSPASRTVLHQVSLDSWVVCKLLMLVLMLGSISEDYIQTLGVNFMEKTISIRNTEITFSVRRPALRDRVCCRRGRGQLHLMRVSISLFSKIWDLGGQREFVSMLPLVSNDAVAILFMFDLTRKSTLNSIKDWYRQSRGFNNVRSPSSRLCLLRGGCNLSRPGSRYQSDITRPELISSVLLLPVDCNSGADWDKVRHVRDVCER